VDQENFLFHGRARQEYDCFGQLTLIGNMQGCKNGAAAGTPPIILEHMLDLMRHSDATD